MKARPGGAISGLGVCGEAELNAERRGGARRNAKKKDKIIEDKIILSIMERV